MCMRVSAYSRAVAFIIRSIWVLGRWIELEIEIRLGQVIDRAIEVWLNPPTSQVTPVHQILRRSPCFHEARACNTETTAIRIRVRLSPQHLRHAIPLQLPRVSTMDPSPQRPKGHDDTLVKLNEAIEDLNRAKEVSSITPAKAVFGSTSALLPTIRVSSFSICAQRLIAG